MKFNLLIFITYGTSIILGENAIVINEINYNSLDTLFNPEDWIEFFNPTEEIIDLYNWEFKDENDSHIYTFNEGESLLPGAYLVLCRDAPIFSSLFPDVDNFIGNLTFGFNGDSELLRLFDSAGVLVDSVHYNDSDPWPEEPNGDGPTLELIDPFSDNSLAENWGASSGYGTPGSVNSINLSIKSESNIPVDFILHNNYPNPFNPQTNIQYSLNIGANVTISIIDINGNQVERLINHYQTTGRFNMVWNADDYSSGIYFIRMKVNNSTQTQKIILIK